jgi:hypothetical protein
MHRLVAMAVIALSAVACSDGSSGRHSALPSPITSPAVSPSAASSSPAASPSAAPAATVPAAAAAPVVCGAAQLSLTVVQGDSGAGQAHQQLVLKNKGATCTLHGYPGVSFIDAAGHLLGSPAAQSASGVRRVTLGAGGAAAALLTYSNAEAYADSRCRPQQASRVRVYPPGSKASLLAADAITVCSASDSGQLHIGAMEPFSG